MRILWVAAKYMAGTPASGLSYEQANFFGTLQAMDGGVHEVREFAFDVEERAHGRAEMRRRFLREVGEFQPELVFAMLFREELPEEIWAGLKRDDSRRRLVNWFADDQWRFDSFTRRYARHFHAALTTDPEAVPRYAKEAGQERVFLSQWGVNHFLYREDPGPAEHELSFVGQAHGDRPRVVAELAARGLKVDCFGKGWGGGFVSQERMMRVFSRSRINLNLANPANRPGVTALAKCVLGRGGRLGLRIKGFNEARDAFSSLFRPSRDQVKGRHFEIPCCGGFQLSPWIPELGQCFEEGKEIATYRGLDEAVEKARYYLTHEGERQALAKAGRERTLRDHSYETRFRDIFAWLDA